MERCVVCSSSSSCLCCVGMDEARGVNNGGVMHRLVKRKR